MGDGGFSFVIIIPSVVFQTATGLVGVVFPFVILPPLAAEFF